MPIPGPAPGGAAETRQTNRAIAGQPQGSDSTCTPAGAIPDATGGLER